MQAEEAGGYDHLLESAVFEEILCQLRQELSTLRATPPHRTHALSERTPQPSFEEPVADTDDRDSLVSDMVGGGGRATVCTSKSEAIVITIRFH